MLFPICAFTLVNVSSVSSGPLTAFIEKIAWGIF